MAARPDVLTRSSKDNFTFATRGSEGVILYEHKSEGPLFTVSSLNDVRSFIWSPDGTQLAYSTRHGTSIWSASSHDIHQLDYPATKLAYSPLGTYLLLWQPYVVLQGQSGQPNLHVIDKEGSLVEEYFQKKHENWLIQWSDDETVCGRNVTNEIHFFDGGRPKKGHSCKFQCENLTSFSLSRGPAPFHVGVHIKGMRGAPSVVRLYRYPNFTGPGSAIANKSFYKADTLQMKWDHEGKGVLVLTTTEVDKSGASYYGEQGLYYLTIKGESFMVQLDKKGPIYAVEWSPKGREFCVVYGFMPSKAGLFNDKCEPIFDFGTTHRNTALYNRHGNLLCLGGFGNLRGNMEFWNMENHKLIGKAQASDTTHLEWSPNGVHVLTATTAPRLRVGNGYKLWDYTGNLLMDCPTQPKHELWEILWCPTLEDIPSPDITISLVSGGTTDRKEKEVKKEVYVPPSLRGKPRPQPIKDEIRGDSQSDQSPLSKSAAKNKRKREAQKRFKDERGEEQRDAISTVSYITKPLPDTTTGQRGEEKEKRLKNLRKKLRQIELLKEQLSSGKSLEANQMDKLKLEQSIIEEIAQLEL